MSKRNLTNKFICYQFSFCFRFHLDDFDGESCEDEFFAGGHVHDGAKVMVKETASNRLGHDDDLRLAVDLFRRNLQMVEEKILLVKKW